MPLLTVKYCPICDDETLHEHWKCRKCSERAEKEAEKGDANRDWLKSGDKEAIKSPPAN